MRIFSLFSLLFFASLSFGQSDAVTVSEEEYKLYQLIMEYRKSNGLESIELSPSLTYVAQTHCKDLSNNKPDIKPECNAHSWSVSKEWTGCCYTADHKMAEAMWSKPSELTEYTGYGFEIAFGSSEAAYSSYVANAVEALMGWKESEGHNNVILNIGQWADTKWNAIGVGIYKGFAVVWFGREPDPSKTVIRR